MEKNKVLTLLGIAIVVILTLSIIFQPYPRVFGQETNSWRLVWAKLVDSYSFEIITIKFNSDDPRRGHLTVISSRPMLFILNIVDGSIVSSYKELIPTIGHLEESNLHISVSKNGRFVAILASPTLLKVFDTRRNEVINIELKYKDEPFATIVRISPSGRYIAVGDESGVVALYRRAISGDGSNAYLPPIYLSQAPSDIPPFSDIESYAPNGLWTVVGTEDAKHDYLVKENEVNLTLRTKGRTTSVAISADGKYIVIGTNLGVVSYFSRDSKIPKWRFEAEEDILSVAISNDGKRVVVGVKKAGGRGGQIHYWSNANQLSGDNPSPTWTIDTDGSVVDVALDERGVRVVAGSTDRKVYFVDKNGVFIWEPKDLHNEVSCVDLSKNGKKLVVGTKRGKIYYFDDTSNSPIWTYNIRYDVTSVAIDSNGDYVIAGGKGRIALLINKNGERLWKFITIGYVVSVDISYDGRNAVVLTSAGRVYYFDTKRGYPEWYFLRRGEGKAVSMSSTGNYVVAGIGGYLLIWSDAILLKGLQGPSWTILIGRKITSLAVNLKVLPRVKLENTGDRSAILKASSTLLYITADGKIYSGALIMARLEDGKAYKVLPMFDSGTIPKDKEVTLTFLMPRNGLEKVSSGTYQQSVILEGSDGDGLPFTQQLNLGSITVP